MRRGSNPALPRVRLSFGGGAGGDKLGSRPWAAVLLLCGMLMLVGCAHVAGRLRLRQLLEASFHGSSSAGSDGNSSTGASGWSKVPLGISSSTAAAVGGGAEADKLQQLQQGMDFGGSSVNPRMQQGSSSSSNASAGALAWRPGVHGRVRKAGMTDPQAWLSNFTDARLDSFLSWRLNRTRAAGAPAGAGAAAATCAAADHPPLPFPGCHVFVNHQYKYIYVRSPKAASTSIVNVLGECDNVRTRGHNSSSCMALHFYWSKAALQLEALQDTWRDYFVFGFVRNPWRRAYSLYKYIHSSGCMSDEALKDPGCRVPWGRFCSDPWSAAEALHDRGCIKRSKSYLYFHMTDQFHCLRTAAGAWAVDFVGRVDEPNEDWAEVVKTLNANRLPGAPELPVAPLEQQNAHRGGESDPYSAAVPWQAQCFDAVSRWYACDVERFGFASTSPANATSSRLQQQQPEQEQQQT